MRWLIHQFYYLNTICPIKTQYSEKIKASINTVDVCYAVWDPNIHKG